MPIKVMGTPVSSTSAADSGSQRMFHSARQPAKLPPIHTMSESLRKEEGYFSAASARLVKGPIAITEISPGYFSACSAMKAAAFPSRTGASANAGE